MSDKPKNGGPAFPSQHLGLDGLPWHEGIDGMSLRDWFAGQALAGVFGRWGDTESPGLIALRSYELADAMLKERDE